MVVYCITNKDTGKQYIGITHRTVEYRWGRHVTLAKSGSPQHIHRAIRKYGKDSFIVEVIADADEGNELCELEKFYIKKYDTFSSGYNMTHGGEGKVGYVTSDKTKKKISESMKGKKHSTATKKKMSDSRQGRTLSEEHKKNIGEANTGKSRPDIAERMGKRVSQYTKDGEWVADYISYGEAAKAVNGATSDVMRCCQGIRKTVKKYIFTYTIEE